MTHASPSACLMEPSDLSARGTLPAMTGTMFRQLPQADGGG